MPGATGPIDPALLHGPHDSTALASSSTAPMPTILKIRLPKPGTKIAGSRRRTPPAVLDKGKGKASKPRGRPSGSSNFTDADVWAMLNIAGKELPLGERGWKAVADTYNMEARKNGRHEHTHRTLLNKFRQASNDHI
jgi:hypothetical protein